LILYVKV
jgi:hypothetical protein